MSKALDIANNLSEFDGLAPAIDLSNVTATNVTGTNITGTNIIPTNLNIASTHHTFTVKGIDETVGTDTQSGQLSIYNGATKLWGINEDGWVQNPNRPSFRSRSGTWDGTTGKLSNWDTSSTTEFDYRNIGNHFNTTTGIFTCPIDGKYLLIAKYKYTSATVARRIGWLYINDVNAGEWVESYGMYQDTTAAEIWYLSAGDTIQFANHPSYPFGVIHGSIEFLG